MLSILMSSNAYIVISAIVLLIHLFFKKKKKALILTLTNFLGNKQSLCSVYNTVLYKNSMVSCYCCNMLGVPC